MPYLNVDDDFPFHRKSIAAGNAALGLWVRCGAWSAGEGTDGRIPEELAKAAGKPGELAALLRAGYWEPAEDGGWQMHDYTDHNMSAEEWRLLSEKRSAAGRKGGTAKRTSLRLARERAGA